MHSYHKSIQSYTKQRMLGKVSAWMYTDWLNYKWLCVWQCNTHLRMNVFQIDSYTFFHNMLCYNIVAGKKWYVLYVLFIRPFYNCKQTHARSATKIMICFQIWPWKMFWNASEIQSPSFMKTTAYLFSPRSQ